VGTSHDRTLAERRMGSEPLRVFLAGASGVIGERLVPLLIGAGHDVAGMTRTPAKAERLRELGAQPVVCDVYDRDALHDAVGAFEPDLVLHQLTDMPDDRLQVPEWAAATRRMYRKRTPTSSPRRSARASGGLPRRASPGGFPARAARRWSSTNARRKLDAW
jgi:hypothetical protein